MPQKLTLQKLADTLIRESRTPFTAEDFANRIQEQWRRKISVATLDRLKRNLADHHQLIDSGSNDFIPYQAVFQKIGHIPLVVPLGKLETEKKVFVPGHRLIPFVPGDRSEGELTFVDASGKGIPKIRKPFLIEDVLHLYQYSGEQHFPDDIQVNEWLPGKSSLLLTVWDITELLRQHRTRRGDSLLVNMMDFDQGLYRIQMCSGEQLRDNQLKVRSVNVALESKLTEMCQSEDFCGAGLEKQLLRALFELDEHLLQVPAFSLTGFLESLIGLTVVDGEDGVNQLVPLWKSRMGRFVRQEEPRIPKGERGSLAKIFRDLGLAFNELEFQAILYTIMSSDEYSLESVFQQLFGGEGKLFYDRRQHDTFYRHLRRLLHKICEDLKQPESHLIADLRSKTVQVKLGLIGILRFLEENEVGLADLPAELLDQVMDLDHFCVQTLEQFADRQSPPDLNFLRDVRMGLKIVLPHMAALEEDVFYRLGIY